MQLEQTDLECALAAWQNLLGREHVLVDLRARKAAETATFTTAQHIPAIIKPANREDVQECLRIANRYKIPVYPISRGKNWGYGSRVPNRDGCVVMDLGRLDRILDYDEKQAYVTVEPGVTFCQLYDFLTHAGSNLMLNVTGGPPEGSLIGNILERGIGVGPYAERAQHACDFEVVLPTGEVLHTGFGRFDTPLAPLHLWGVGPHLNGLFLQSNYGVVTRMTLWLAPKPEYFHSFYFNLQRPERLPELIDALQRLRLAGPPGAQYSLWNDYKMLATLQQYPWQATGGRTPLPLETLQQLREDWDVRPWNGFGGIYSCSARAGRADRDLIAKALRGRVDDLRFVSDRTVRLARVFARPLQRLTGFDVEQATRPHARDTSPWFGAPRGNIESAYWRKRTPIPRRMDPDADGCGIIWCSPCVPFDGRHVGAAIDIAARVFNVHRFEPNVALLMATPRAIHTIISIIFDRETNGEDERALACHDTLLCMLITQGYLPYRLGIQSMHALPSRGDDRHFDQLLKRAIDPNNILAPDRYSL